MVSCAGHYHTTSDDQVTLTLRQPVAATVVFFSSLNGFQGVRLVRQHAGLWEITLPANRPFRYFYQVDGEYYLPDCPMKEKDDFGAQNCIFTPDL